MSNTFIVFTEPFIAHGTLNLVRFVFTEPFIACTRIGAQSIHYNIYKFIYDVNG